MSQLTLRPLRLPDLWVSSCGSRPHRDILRSSSKSDSKAASLESTAALAHWGSGTRGSLGFQTSVLLLLVLTALPLESGGGGWSAEVQRGDRARSPENLETLGAIRKAVSSRPREWASLLGSPCHSINTSTRGQGKEYFGLGDKMEKTFLSALPFSNPQPAPPQKRKKKSSMCTEGKGKRGERVLFSFTIKKSQQDVLQSYKYTFSNSKYLY